MCFIQPKCATVRTTRPAGLGAHVATAKEQIPQRPANAVGDGFGSVWV